jgi:conjugal transfer pilus assembly protein TrbC
MFTILHALLIPLLPLLLLLASVAMALLAPAHAQAPVSVPALSRPPAPLASPSASDLKAARSAMSSQADIDAAMAAQSRALPRVPGAALDPRVQRAPDLADLAAQYERIRQGPQGRTGDDISAERQAQGLLVFASLGMPRASLDRLIADAERAQALIVLRGVLEGSLHKTSTRVRELVGTRKVAWQVDPTLFRKFEVSAVPTFVLIDPSHPVLVACGATQCQQAAFSKVAGDVTTGFAMDAIRRQDPGFAALAARYIARLGDVGVAP